jgi:hypothetical protein
MLNIKDVLLSLGVRTLEIEQNSCLTYNINLIEKAEFEIIGKTLIIKHQGE